MNEPVSNLLGQIRITDKSEQIAYQSLINKLIVWGKSWCHSDPLERACRGQPCVYGARCQNKQHPLMLMGKQCGALSRAWHSTSCRQGKQEGHWGNAAQAASLGGGHCPCQESSGMVLT